MTVLISNDDLPMTAATLRILDEFRAMSDDRQGAVLIHMISSVRLGTEVLEALGYPVRVFGRGPFPDGEPDAEWFAAIDLEADRIETLPKVEKRVRLASQLVRAASAVWSELLKEEPDAGLVGHHAYMAGYCQGLLMERLAGASEKGAKATRDKALQWMQPFGDFADKWLSSNPQGRFVKGTAKELAGAFIEAHFPKTSAREIPSAAISKAAGKAITEHLAAKGVVRSPRNGTG